MSFSRNIGEKRKREIIHDAVDIFRTNGTERALRRIFRLIGWDVDVDYIYALHPSWAGLTQNVDQNASNYSPVAVNTVIYGRLNVQSDGVYVDLYDEAAVVYPKFRVWGESYRTSAPADAPYFIKTPYIRIRVKEEDYQLFTDPYTDSKGTTYEYTETEKFAITQEAITYFLEQSRPANVVIIDISTPLSIADDVLNHITVPVDDTVVEIEYINAMAKYDGTLAYGVPTDRYELGTSMEVGGYGSPILNVGVPYTTPINRTYPVGTVGRQDHLPLREGSVLTLTIPADATVRVYVSSDDRIKVQNGTAAWLLKATRIGGGVQTVDVGDDSMTVYLNITTASSVGPIILSLT